MKVLAAIIELVCKHNDAKAKASHYLEIDSLKREEVKFGKELEILIWMQKLQIMVLNI